MLAPVNRIVMETTLFNLSHHGYIFGDVIMLQTSCVLAAIVVNSNNLVNCSPQKKYEEDQWSFPSQSPLQFLTFPNPSSSVTLHLSQWFLWIKRSKEETHWFFCIIASHSECLFHWEAVSKTTRALILVVLWLFLPGWNKTIRPPPLCSFWGWVRCCQLLVAHREMWLLVLGQPAELMKPLWAIISHLEQLICCTGHAGSAPKRQNNNQHGVRTLLLLTE